MARAVALLVGLCLSVTVTVFLTVPQLFATTRSFSPTVITSASAGYIVETTNCKIPNVSPYDPSVVNYFLAWKTVDCTAGRKPPIIYKDGLWLRINKTAMKYYKGKFGICHLQEIVRGNGSDDKVTFVPVTSFSKDIKVDKEFVKVQCNDSAGEEIALNLYAFLQPTPVIEKKLRERRLRFQKKPQAEKPLNVILLGTDSVSRLNLIRQLPKTRDFLLSDLDAVELLGYNKVADNTFPNIVPLLTGHFTNELGINGTNVKREFFDKYDYVWKRYTEAGYTTMYIEDHPEISTFNYLKRGFLNPPTDYYYRPFALAMEEHKRNWNKNHVCFGDRMEIEFIFEWLENFLQLSHTTPTFSFTLLSRLSHDYINKIQIADAVYLKFLKDLKAKGLLMNSLLVFYSDHGIRFGPVRETYIGKMEERLPMMLISLPKWFKERHPVKFRNLKGNAKRLTSPFDIHATLLEVLNLSFTNASFPGGYRKRGLSLFSSIPSNRTCREAWIHSHWCTCHSQIQIPLTNGIVNKLAMVTISHINHMISKAPDCAQLSLEAVRRVWRSQLEETFKPDVYRSKTNATSNTYQISLSTNPGGGMFEASVRHFKLRNHFEAVGHVSRINRYGNTSHCVGDSDLKLYCFCNT